MTITGDDVSLRRPVIIVFVGRYLPGYRAGGPIRTIASMVDSLGAEFDFRIVAADRDIGDREPYTGITVNSWNRVGNAQVLYLAPDVSGWKALWRSLSLLDYDLVYLNSVFSVDSTIRPLLLRRICSLRSKPVILAPRGELDEGALSIKWFKKKSFLAVAVSLGLYKNLFWHASSQNEALSVLRHTRARDDEVFIAPNLTGMSIGRHENSIWEPGKELKIVFLSRISAKKNLSFALEVIGRLSMPVLFDIVGPIQDESYWKRCLSMIRSLPKNISVRYLGEVRSEDVEKTLVTYDLFFLPTLGENYGHAIREALSAGVPVLISDRTPWRELETKGVGADIPLERLESFVEWIDSFARLDPLVHQALRHRARLFGNDRVVAEANLEANRAMFRALVGSLSRSCT